MTSSAPIALLEEIQKLMTLIGENPFKVRAFERAAHALAGREDLRERARAGTLTELEGVGKGIAEVLTEYLLHNRSPVRDQLLEKIPRGLLELTELSGLGPKKAHVLIEELGIHSLAELEYACRENRLVNLKGFGEKAQAKILKAIEERKANEGQWLLPVALEKSAQLLQLLQNVSDSVAEAGPVLRRSDVVDRLEYVVKHPAVKAQADHQRKLLERVVAEWSTHHQLPVTLRFCDAASFGSAMVHSSSAPAHWEALVERAAKLEKQQKKQSELESQPTEEGVYSVLGLTPVSADLRETAETLRAQDFSSLLEPSPTGGLKGIFHVHTTRSDGQGTLEQMVKGARDRGYEYIGVSDHSQSAFYASGLSPAALKEQQGEIQELQKKYPEIKIFFGIESDILQDGSLDYPDSVLKRFDFVIASIHSRFQMSETAMTERLIQAIKNPYTTQIGHLTGRLLLGRKGYGFDVQAVFQAAAEHQVVIELNAHPSRLDVDWRLGAELRKWGVMTSVNPDAHEVSGLDDVRWGVWMARKALIPSQQILNSLSASQVTAWLKKRRPQ